MARQHNSKNIRALLIEGFSEEELRYLCFDMPTFKPVYHKLAKGTGKTEIIQQLLEYTEQKELIETLLNQVEKSNPAKYKKYQPYYEVTTPTISNQRIQVYLHGDFPSLSPERKSAALDAFAAIIGVSPQVIEVHRIYEGSIVFDLGIPPDAFQRLRSLLQSNNAQLRLLKVKKVLLEKEPGKIEEWIIKEGKFALVAPLDSTISSDVHGKSQRDQADIQAFFENFELDATPGLLRLAEDYRQRPHELTGDDFRNIAAGIEWCYQNQQWQQVLDFIPPLSDFFDQQAFWAEGIHLIELALQADAALGQTSQRPQLYFWLGLLYDRQGLLAEAEPHYQTSAELAGQLKQPPILADAYHRLGWVAHSRRDYAQAKSFYAEAKAIRETLHPADPLALSRSWHQLGILEQDLGHYDVARSNYEQALALRRTEKADYLIAASLHQLGALAIEQQAWTQAEDHFQEALTRRRSINDRDGEAQALDQLGVIAQRQGRLDEAYKYYIDSLTLKEKLKDAAGLIRAQMHLGEICLARQEWDTARRWFEDCLKRSEALTERHFEAHACLQLGYLALLTPDFEQAEHYYQRSYEVMAKLDGTEREQAGILYQLGLIAFEQNRLSAALERYLTCLGIQEFEGFAREAAQTHLQLGMVYQAQDIYDVARQHYETSYAMLTKEGGEIADQSQAIYRLGNIAELSRQPEKAFEYYRQAKALCQTNQLPPMAGLPAALERVKKQSNKSLSE